MLECREAIRMRPAIEAARLTDPQRRWVGLTDRLALWRGGNQLGKSWGQAWDIVAVARGNHPYRKTPRAPVRLLVVSESWAQMDPLCEKLWQFLPKDEIDPRIRYEPGGGFRGFKEPRIPFVAGPGAGSLIVFATYRQGAGRIAGGSFHGAYLDEPPPESVFGEIIPRLTRYHGFLRITLTPTPESPPMAYLRDLVEKGTVREMQTSLSTDALTPRGSRLGDRAWKTAEQIEEHLSAYLDVERGMREHGDWDPVVAGRWLTAFSPDLITTAEPQGRLWVAVGIDHGAKAGRQASVLVAATDDGEEVWYLDEIRSDGRTSPREDAQAILAMLERNGWNWRDVDYWIGDRAHGGDFWGNEKSNADLLHEFGKLLDLPAHKLRTDGLRLQVPFKRAGSVMRGLRLMNGLFREKQARVHMRCQSLIDSIKSWDGKKEDPKKDILDAARYPTEVLVDARVLQPRLPATARIY